MDFYYSTLNDKQKEAVQYDNGPLCIIAGPGSGKTRVLTLRIIRKILSGEMPSKILALTFTNKAAEEMKQRIIPVLRENGIFAMPFIGTFHGWALNFLKNTLGDTAFKLIDDEDTIEIFKELCSENDIKKKDINKFFSEIKSIKQRFPFKFSEPELEDIFNLYQRQLNAYSFWDYDDVIIQALTILDDTKLNGFVSGKYTRILVDEFQDLSPVQFDLLKKLVNRGGNLFVIGDPDQSIYSFRGATPDIFGSITQECPRIKIINLDLSYRNPENILNNAYHVIKNQTKIQKSRSFSDKKAESTIMNFTDETDESKWIAKKIKELTGNQDMGLISSFNNSPLYEFSQIAVLYRTHSISNALKKELSRQNIPYITSQKESSSNSVNLIKILSYIHSARQNKKNIFYLSRLEKLLKQNINDILKLIDNTLEMENNELVDFVVGIAGIKPDHITKQIIQKLRENTISMEDLPVHFREEIDYFYNESSGVSLLTLHSSKGLEFPVVFIIGMEEDILPLKNSDISEERRLFYVGLTRASEKVFLSNCMQRELFYCSVNLQKSSFLTGLDIEEKTVQSRASIKKKPKQQGMF